MEYKPPFDQAGSKGGLWYIQRKKRDRGQPGYHIPGALPVLQNEIHKALHVFVQVLVLGVQQPGIPEDGEPSALYSGVRHRP